jgi:hypothetical protein
MSKIPSSLFCLKIWLYIWNEAHSIVKKMKFLPQDKGIFLMTQHLRRHLGSTVRTHNSLRGEASQMVGGNNHSLHVASVGVIQNQEIVKSKKLNLDVSHHSWRRSSYWSSEWYSAIDLEKEHISKKKRESQSALKIKRVTHSMMEMIEERKPKKRTFFRFFQEHKENSRMIRSKKRMLFQKTRNLFSFHDETYSFKSLEIHCLSKTLL